MSLIKQSGNMYSFVTHTWNPVKGKCWHDCSYCYMKRFNLKDVRLDEKELRTDLGKGNFIFVGSGTDLFAHTVPGEWISRVMNYCKMFDNKYLFQSKNPGKFMFFDKPVNSVLGATIETNRLYEDIIGMSPHVSQRAYYMTALKRFGFERMVTIEPILDFDLFEFIEMMKEIEPDWINIGADSKDHKLPEPGKDKILNLISELEKFTTVKIKSNMKRLMA